MPLILYGIYSCSTVRAARKWMREHNVDYRFFDFRKDKIQRQQVDAFCKTLSWESLLNKRSVTWRSLPDREKQALSPNKAAHLMAMHPTLIKRPILEKGNGFYLGFSIDVYRQLFER